MLVSVNSVDITNYIDKDTYSVNSKKVYESWQNANFVEIRVPIRKRVEGKFKIRCGKGLSYSDFLTNWESAVENDVVTLGVFVQNDNEFEAIEAFYSFTGEKHVELDSGAIYDEITVEIEEC